MAKERRQVAKNAKEEQVLNDLDYEEAQSNLFELGQCFWRFAEVKPMLDQILNDFTQVLARQSRQIKLYVTEV